MLPVLLLLLPVLLLLRRRLLLRLLLLLLLRLVLLLLLLGRGCAAVGPDMDSAAGSRRARGDASGERSRQEEQIARDKVVL